MKDERRRALNQFGKGNTAGHVAAGQPGMNKAAVEVAKAGGIGDAVEYMRAAEARKRAARKRSKQARRVNR